jgi:hypothetical protein
MHPDPSSDINTDILTEEMSKSSSDLRNDKSIFQVISNYKREVSIFLDAVSVLIILKDKLIKQLFNKKNEQKRIRIITEINNDNIQSCKELIKFGVELRHLMKL